jgi:hypothetical protein
MWPGTSPHRPTLLAVTPALVPGPDLRAVEVVAPRLLEVRDLDPVATIREMSPNPGR